MANDSSSSKLVLHNTTEALENAQKYPLLPLRDVVVFPYMVVPLFVGRRRSVRSVEEAMLKNRKIVLCSQKQPQSSDPETGELLGGNADGQPPKFFNIFARRRAKYFSVLNESKSASFGSFSISQRK